MSNRTASSRRKKQAARPPKPYADFPLTPAGNGQWVKKIRGTIRRFGPWGRVVKGELTRLPDDGWERALKLYQAQREDLVLGRTPRVTSIDDAGNEATQGALTVGKLCDEYYEAQRQKLEAGELSVRTLAEADATCRRLVAEFGKSRRIDDLRPDDFARLRASLAKQYGPVRLANSIGRVRSVFRFAVRRELIDRVVRYGDAFDKPSKSVMRKHKAASGPKMLEASEIRLMLDYLGGKEVSIPGTGGDAGPVKLRSEPDPVLRALVLLGVNAGFGASDCSALPVSAVDLDAGVIDFARVKTGIARRVPLWPETVAALRAAIDSRPAPEDPAHADRVFLTVRGLTLVRADKQTKCDDVAVRFGRLVRKLKLHRPGIGHYTLRHVHRTVSDEAMDQAASNALMGHADHTMAGNYRQRISDARLRAVVDHVRGWLFGSSEPAGAPSSGKPTEADARPALRVVG